MPREGKSRNSIVLKAAELFRRQGYSGTGLKQIIEESGAPRGSLYFYFPGGKEQLAVEALGQACDDHTAAMRNIFDRTSGALEAMRELARELRDGLVRSDFREGCPIATVVLETAATSDALQQTCSKALRTWTELFDERLRLEGHPPERARRLATVSLSMLEGGLLLGRAYRSTEPLDTVREELGAILRTERASNTKEKRR